MRHRIILKLDDLDYKAIMQAISRRDSFRIDGKLVMPDYDSNAPGAYLAEICRGWLEFLDARRPT